VDLTQFKKNRYSQNGEDGILSKAFEVLAVDQGYFCEFGAWDGKHFSNSYRLYELGWRGCYVEGSAARYRDLLANVRRPEVKCVCAFVSPEGENSLDNILRGSGAKEVDLLSIDVDSDDLAIWRSLSQYRPKVVVIEYNPTIPIDIEFENPPGENKGNSALSIFRFASGKRYELVAATDTNLVFVDGEANRGKLGRFNIWDREMCLGPRYFFGYDGTLIRTMAGTGTPQYQELFRVPWNGVIFPQPVPRLFRRFDANSLLAGIGIFISAVVTAITRPVSVIGAILNAARLKR
jgi:hypothetical protein